MAGEERMTPAEAHLVNWGNGLRFTLAEMVKLLKRRAKAPTAAEREELKMARRMIKHWDAAVQRTEMERRP